MPKCHFGVKQVDFLGRRITPEGVASQVDKVNNFLSKLRFPKTKKALQRHIGFLNYYRSYIPRLLERLSPFFELLKETSKIFKPTNLVKDFTTLNKILGNSCQLALKQPLKNKQLIVMSDARFTAAGYAIMIEEETNQKLQSKRKTYAPVAFGSKTFNQTQTKMSIYAKEFLSIYFAFVEFGHLIWGNTFPVILFTDNRSVTRFFQAKMLLPALWNACDYVLQHNFVIAHVAYSMNTAADFLSRTEIDPTEKLEITLRNGIHTKAIKMTSNHPASLKNNKSMFSPLIKLTKMNSGKKNKMYGTKPKRKPTTTQKMRLLNYNNFINPHQDSSQYNLGSSRTMQEFLLNRTMT